MMRSRWGAIAVFGLLAAPLAAQEFSSIDRDRGNGATGRRAGAGDLSREGGGLFVGHVGHQNGREADLRYVRRGGAAQDTLSLDLRSEPAQLDTNETIRLWNCLHSSPRVEYLIIDSVYFRGFILNDPKLRFDTSRVHANHFHARILDPDGDNN